LELSSLPINMQKQIIDYLEEQLNAYAEAEKSQKCKLQWFISEATLANNFKSMPVSSLEITQSVLKILWKRLVDQGVIKSPKINISNKDPEKTKKINDLKSWLRKEIIS